jgi:hypothetical protein
MEIPEGVYLDPQTKLTWTKEDSGRDINWHEANQYADGVRLGGYSDWRLPTIEQLEGLYDPKEKDKIRKPFKLTGWWVWSSTKEGSGTAWASISSAASASTATSPLQQLLGFVCVVPEDDVDSSVIWSLGHSKNS